MEKGTYYALTTADIFFQANTEPNMGQGING
jgi:hypothetical protein